MTSKYVVDTITTDHVRDVVGYLSFFTYKDVLRVLQWVDPNCHFEKQKVLNELSYLSSRGEIKTIGKQPGRKEASYLKVYMSNL